jgi:HlyD family secretion protein
MRLVIRLLIAAAVLGGLGYAAYRPAASYLKERNRPRYREDAVARRTVSMVVNSTGEVKPVLSVSVGSFVSGPIEKLHVEFNDRVKKDQLLAEIDPRIYVAAVQRDQAALATRQADVERIKALLQQAINDENRSIALRKENPDFISQAEIDRFHFNRLSLKAQLDVAVATVEQAQATLDNSVANVDYTKIRSPVDGIVINRKIDPGQTLAAQFQTPELFIIAPDMDKKMYIYASVDEADIGLIRQAQERKRPVHFTVSAYPDDLFTGEVEQIRFSSTVTSNVVTYPVVVAAPNPDLKLLPGMTADLSFDIEEKQDVLCVPNAALRFYPEPRLVRPEDRKLLDGTQATAEDQEEEEEQELSARQKAEAGAKRNRRHVWVQDGELLRAVEIVTGLSDNRYTEVVQGKVQEGQKLVTGLKTADDSG